MWYEVLPSVGVIFTMMSIAGAATSFVPNMILGKPGLRRVIEIYDWEYYLRDKQLTGSPYKLQGLESIPDGEPQKK